VVPLTGATMRRFSELHPGVRLTVSNAGLDRPAAGLHGGTVDVAFVRPPFRDEGISMVTVLTEGRFAVLPKDHPLAARDHVRPEDVVDEPWIWVEGADPLARAFWSSRGHDPHRLPHHRRPAHPPGPAVLVRRQPVRVPRPQRRHRRADLGLPLHRARRVRPPRHVHTREDEVFHVVEGDVCFEIDGRRQAAGPGSTVWMPRGVPHGFRVESPVATMLGIITPGDYEHLFRALGVPAQARELPPLDGPALDVAALVAEMAARGTQVVGPPIGE
jgi:mannose-6-phosphate isomerase-like protein (cupin superfamily)